MRDDSRASSRDTITSSQDVKPHLAETSSENNKQIA